MVAVVPTNLQLIQLRGIINVTQRQAEHSKVGGDTADYFSIDFTCTLQDESVTPPDFYGSSLKDILEFAPKYIHTKHVLAPDSILPSTRADSLLYHDFLPNN